MGECCIYVRDTGAGRVYGVSVWFVELCWGACVSSLGVLCGDLIGSSIASSDDWCTGWCAGSGLAFAWCVLDGW